MNPSRAPVAHEGESRLAALRDEVRAIEQVGRAAERPAVPFGIDEVDARLAAGGLALALHEAAAVTPEPGDEAAAILFLAAAAGRCVQAQGGQVLWALARQDLFAPALAQAGLPPDRVVYADCRDEAETLAVMEEGLRYGGLAAVVGEVRRADMANLRRLQLGAEGSGTAALLLRRWRKQGADPFAATSPAVTRWRIGCAPAAPLPYAGIGRVRWQIALARQRGGPPHEWILEAPDAEARLALAARSGDRPDQARRADRSAAPSHALAA